MIVFCYFNLNRRYSINFKLFTMKFTSPLLLLTLIFFTSCSRLVYFTRDVRERLENSNIPLTAIQYYNDKKVTLMRELESDHTDVQSGKVKFENGKYINYIILKQKTPGVCNTIFSDQFGISFEPGNDHTINFIEHFREYYNTYLYQIFALEWINNVGKVSYEGYIYNILPKGSDARLMIEKDVLNNIDIDKRRMKGIKIK